MKRFILILVLLTVFLVGCTKSGCDGEGNTLEDFEFLELGMSYEEVSKCVGQRLSPCSSHLCLAYNLDDGSIVRLTLAITYNGGSELTSAVVLYPDGTQKDLLTSE